MDIEELVALMRMNTQPEDLLGNSNQDFSHVYAVTKGIAVKVYKSVDVYPSRCTGISRDSLEGNATWDFYVGTCLYKAGIHVPKPLGITSLPFSDASMPEFLTADDTHTHEDTWYFFMQRIYATPPIEWTHAERKEVWRQYKDQIKKAESLGFESLDSAFDHNTLFSRKEQKLYLIDFVRWEKRTRKQ